MITVQLQMRWIDSDPDWEDFEPGHWSPVVLLSEGPADALTGFMINHDNDLEEIDKTRKLIDDLIAGRDRPGWVTGDNDCGVAYGNGYFFIENDYVKDQRVVVTAEQFRAAFDWLRDLRTNPDFTNPDATIEPLTVTVIACGLGSGQRYRELGGSFFNESHPPTDHLN